MEVLGYTISVDATALSASVFYIGGVAGNHPTSSPASFTLIPGSKSFGSTDISFSFLIILHGTLAYDLALEPQVTGAGTSTLTVAP